LLLDDARQRWAVAMIEEKIGPEGAAALGVVLQEIQREIQQSLDRSLREQATEFRRGLQEQTREFRRLTLMIVIPVAMALLGVLLKAYFPRL